jgi:hypothetical protein
LDADGAVGSPAALTLSRKDGRGMNLTGDEPSTTEKLTC